MDKSRNCYNHQPRKQIKPNETKITNGKNGIASQRSGGRPKARKTNIAERSQVCKIFPRIKERKPNQMKYLKAYTLLMFGILIGMGVCQWIELILTK
jgi:hypothetical protein